MAREPSRRTVLTSTGLLAVGLAGCLTSPDDGQGDGDDGAEEPRGDVESQPPANESESTDTESTAPVVRTLVATTGDRSSATLNGEVTDLAGYDEVDAFFEWRAVGDDEFATTDPYTMTEFGSFGAEVDGLQSATEYEFRAVLLADDQRFEADLVRFEEPPSPPTVESRPATDVDETTATLNGELTDVGDHETVSVSFHYRVLGLGEWTETDPQTLTEPGEYSATVDLIEPDEIHEFRAVATFDDRENHGRIFEFRDLPDDGEPSVSGDDVDLEAVCSVDCGEERAVEFRASNDTDDDLTVGWRTEDESTRGTATVPANGEETFWTVCEDPVSTVSLVYEGETVATASADVGECF